MTSRRTTTARSSRRWKSSIKLADGAAERVAGFVRGIKSETRNLASVETRIFNAVPVVQDTLLLLNHAARKGNCAVTFQHESENMELRGSARKALTSGDQPGDQCHRRHRRQGRRPDRAPSLTAGRLVWCFASPTREWASLPKT